MTEAYYNMGILYLKIGNFKGGLEAFKKVVEIDSDLARKIPWDELKNESN